MLFRRFGILGLVGGVALVYFFGPSSEGPSGEGAVGEAPSIEPSVSDPKAQGEQPLVEFVSFVLDDVQRSWSDALGAKYRPARLVIFRDRTSSACGLGEAAMGPFYCPPDERVFIDLSFYEDLRQRFGAAGDFAQAYVIAHELGHHVQSLLGTSARVQAAPRNRQKGPKGLLTRLELQADCYAGVWAHSAKARDLLETGDLEEALRAAAAIGDDRIQKKSRGTVSPESWTHGSSEQRSRWFRRGFDKGRMEDCDTFGVDKP
jgi:hypothetical protein